MRAAPQPEPAGPSQPDTGATRHTPERDPDRMAAWRLAIGLSLGSAIALGLARFSYALLLPPMKADLGWTFAQAGALNTANAAGYLIGALVFPLLSRRWRAGTLLAAGCVLTALLMAACGFTSGMHALLAQRLATGVGSALIFISGGVLAARLASASPRDAGLLLGLYYGGTGWGIVASSLLVPATLAQGVHGWQPAWFALAFACVLFSAVAVSAARRIERVHAAP
ncbi:YbfB/YjiJ family MFS transporter, partial [Burkholderia sp. HAN2018]